MAKETSVSAERQLPMCEKCGMPLFRVGLEGEGVRTYWGRDQYGMFILCPGESCRHRNHVFFKDKSQCLVCCNDLIQPQGVRPGEDVEFTAAGLEGDTLFFKCPSCGNRNALEEDRGGLRVVRLLD